MKRVLHLSDTHAEHMLPSEFDRWLEACSFPVVCRPQVEFLKTWAVQGQNTPFPLAELHRFAAPARRSGMFVAAASSRTAAAPPPGAAFVSHPANKPPTLLRSPSRSSEEDGEDQLLESEEDAGPPPIHPVTKHGPPQGKRSKNSSCCRNSVLRVGSRPEGVCNTNRLTRNILHGPHYIMLLAY